MRAFVENSSNTAESLLASSIPDLELNDVLVIYAHDIVSKLHSNCDVVLVIELIINESCQNARFTHTYKSK